MAHVSVITRFGRLGLEQRGDAIVRVFWNAPERSADTPLLREAEAQMRAYDAGHLTRFDLPLAVTGTAFQRAVCDAICRIGHGQTRSYGEIASDLGVGARSVGRACGANPIPVVIPCHRVMGANGRLTGFSGAGGVETKVALLVHEGAAGLLI